VAQLANVVGLVTCTLAEAPGARSPKLQLSDWGLPEIEQAGLAGLTDQLIPLPVGSASESVTALAVLVPAAPLFVTVIVKPMLVPALTLAASATLVIERAGHCTVVEAEAVTGGLFVACAEAAFGYVAQLAKVVPLTTCTLNELPAARVATEQLSVWGLGAVPAIEQLELEGLIDQLMPVPIGNASETVTFCAAPCPLLLTVIVKPIWSPAFTVALSAVFVMPSLGQLLMLTG